MGFKDQDGRYTPLAYALLGVLALAAVVMVVMLASSGGWGVSFENRPREVVQP